MIINEPWGGGIGQTLENVYTAGTILVLASTTFSLDSGNILFNDGLETGVKLTPGVWDLQVQAQLLGAAATTISRALVFPGTAIGTGGGGLDGFRNEGVLGGFAVGSIIAPARSVICSEIYRVAVLPGTTQTWYGKAFIVWAAGASCNATGGIRASKVATI